MGYFQVRYDSRVVIYEHKMCIRLATDHCFCHFEKCLPVLFKGQLQRNIFLGKKYFAQCPSVVIIDIWRFFLITLVIIAPGLLFIFRLYENTFHQFKCQQNFQLVCSGWLWLSW